MIRALGARRLRAVAAAGAAMLAACGAVVTWVAQPLPAELVAERAEPGFVITDRHGLVLRSTRAADGSRHRWVPLEEIDPDLIAAFVAAEDHRFFRHQGVDVVGVGRAALANLRAGRVVSGASTIPMQLARLVRPLPRTWSGKARQVLWALRLEHHLGKQEILEQYLNRIPLGQGAVGVEAAAALYFGGSAGSVSVGQAAMLAGVARAPSASNPLASPARAARVRNLVLARLEATGYVSADAAERARGEPATATGTGARFLAPHFTTRLLADGAPPPADGRRRTSLDAVLQARVEAEVAHTAAQLAARGGPHAAAVVLDNATGEVLAWVGSPDFWSDTAGQVDMVTGLRQPGSTLKPFLYALALDRRDITAASVIPDLPRVFQTGTGPYAPRNYDRRFHGPVRAREALASSYNVPAVELAERVGAAALLAALHRAGFASLTRDADHYGLGLALGNGEVSLIELANGYRALAERGVWRPWRTWTGSAAQPPGRRVVSGQAAALVLDILADPVARIPGFGTGSALELPFPMAAKTGTSRHFTDNWAVGVTRRFTVAVWVGNFDGTAMDGVSGVTGAGPLLHRVALATAERYDPGALPAPASVGLERARICRLSGMLATGGCAAMDEWFIPGTAPHEPDTWQRDGVLALPAEYAEWGEREGLVAGDRATGRQGDRATGPQGDMATGPQGGGAAPLRIVSPREGDRYRVPPGVEGRYATIPLRVAGGRSTAVRWTVDGVPVAAGRWPLAPGSHLLVAELAGTADSVRFTVE